MSKRGEVGLLLLSLCLLLVGAWKLERKETFTYEADDRPLSNPGRGFYVQVESDRPEEFYELYADEIRLSLLTCDLGGYLEQRLDAKKLSELRTALSAAEKNHVQVIFRAAYGFEKECAEPEDIKWLGIHIQQISEVLNEFPGVILTVQAGMLGPYGEWHSSRFLQEGDGAAARYYVLQQWESCLNPQYQVSVRRPRFIREAWEKGLLEGRLALHNDALLSTDTDMGTYDDEEYSRVQELEWMEENLKDGCSGGEMPGLTEWTSPEYADREFRKLHLTYLNLKYNEEVLQRWKIEPYQGTSAFDYIERRLGYRLFVPELHMTTKSTRVFDHWAEIEIRLENLGYGPLNEEFNIYLILDREGERCTLPMEKCAGGWSAGGWFPFPVDKNTAIGVKIAPDCDADSFESIQLANELAAPWNGVNWLR